MSQRKKMASKDDNSTTIIEDTNLKTTMSDYTIGSSTRNDKFGYLSSKVMIWNDGLSSLQRQTMDPGVYVVATPIGNIFDITVRALFILRSVDFILAEDTRVTRNLCRHYGIDTRIERYDIKPHYLMQKAIAQIKLGAKVALVSDAGTPLISDPGLFLITECLKNNIKCYPIPGSSSVIAAMSVAAIRSEKFVFYGFVHDDMEEFLLKLKAMLFIPVVCFVPPHDLIRVLSRVKSELGDIGVAIMKEMTKLFESITYGTIGELLEQLSLARPRGEYVVIFHKDHYKDHKEIDI